MFNNTLEIIEDSSTDVDIYGALSWGIYDPDDQKAVLYSDGCRVNGTRDCTKACLDTTVGPSIVWNSPDTLFTLHNCIEYPRLSTAAAHGELSAESSKLLEKYNIIANDTLPANASNVNAWPVISGCLRKMCFRYYGLDNETECPLPDYIFRNWTVADSDWDLIKMVSLARMTYYVFLFFSFFFSAL